MKARTLNKVILASTCAVALALAGCSSDGADSSKGSDDKAFDIGISQLISHPSLDAIAKGFKDVLKEEGLDIKYEEQNAQGDIATAGTIASSFAANSSLDLILAIATPAAQPIVNAITDVPVLFAGVTDPVDAGLVDSEEGSGTNVTGTSDLNPEAKPVALIKELVPDAKTVGVLYSSSETNSEVQVKALKAEAKTLGITIKESAVTRSSEVAAAAQSLNGVDALYVPTDNTVVSTFETVVAFAESKQIPLFSADVDSVERGAIATRGIDYYEMGRRTGEIAVRVLVEDEDPGTIPTLVVTDTDLVVNSEAAKRQGLTLSEEFLADATVVGGES